MHIRISITIFTLNGRSLRDFRFVLFIIRYQVSSSYPAPSVLEVSSGSLPDNYGRLVLMLRNLISINDITLVH
jgi:hypothetical protein